MAYLVQKYKDEEMARWEIGDAPIIFGRAVEATVFIEDPGVSREHCQVEKKGDSYIITDLDSHNGTFVNGKQIVQAQLQNGDEIIVGKYIMVFIDEEIQPQPAEKPEKERMLLKHEIKHGPKIDEKKWYLNVKIKDSEQTTSLFKSDYLIGKSSNCEIELSGWGVSNVHALLIKDINGLMILNVSDKKPIFINDKEAPKKSVISNNDMVKIGKYELRLFQKD